MLPTDDAPWGGWSPAAVVFDCDGLLMDTEPCWTVAETELFRRRGFGFGDEEKALLIGRSLDDAGVALAERFGVPGTHDELIDELMVLVYESVASTAQAMAGARRVVDAIAARVPVAVASNSPRALLDAALERGGLSDVFEVSIAADEVAHPKPAPDMYLAACDRLGVPSREALAFEDSGTGLRSAVAAHLRTLAIPSLPGTTLDADWTLPALDDPRLFEWIARWPVRSE